MIKRCYINLYPLGPRFTNSEKVGRNGLKYTLLESGLAPLLKFAKQLIAGKIVLLKDDTFVMK